MPALRRFPFLVLLAAALLLGIPAGPAAAADVAYNTDIRLQGLDDAALLGTLRNASQLVSLENRPPPTAAALRQRAQNDAQRLQGAMQAEGYWDARVAFTVDTKASPAQVAVTVVPGALYHLAKVDFRTPAGEALPLLEKLGPSAFGLVIGGPARSAPVAAANDRIVEQFAANGHPFAKVTDRKALVDVASHTMSATYTVDPGAPARFGGTAIVGLKRTDRDFVARRIAWQEGAPYDSRAVDKTRADLVRTGLFAAVRITHGDSPDARDEVPMVIDLTEGPPRSIGAGVAYSTNLGLGARAFWEHRNLFGQGEKLNLSAGVAQRQLGLAANFRKPDFLAQDQDLLSSAEFLQENTEAYKSLRGRVFTGLERRLLPSLVGGAGVSLERANVEETDRSEHYALVGLPLYLRRDTTDDLLDPTIGSRQSLTIIPYRSVSGPDLTFVSSRLEARYYHRLDDTGHMVLAGFGALGSIVGASRNALPADKRLYAGGAGSVRAYGYQMAGPLDALDKPLGGISSLELGAEFRYRITDTIGIAPFVEAGNVYPRSLPNSLKLFAGGGIGFRYYTAIGPIRIDLATPFERRRADSPIQFYISIGQAF